FLINKGIYPSYLLINKIIINMTKYKNKSNLVCLNILEKMLLLSVSHGSELDIDQYNMVSFLGKNIVESVMLQYSQPYWRKTCKGVLENDHLIQQNSPYQLKKMAISLNIDPSSG